MPEKRTVKSTVACNNTNHDITVYMDDKFNIHIVHSPCLQQYGRAFGLMMQCSQTALHKETNFMISLVEATLQQYGFDHNIISYALQGEQILCKRVYETVKNKNFHAPQSVIDALVVRGYIDGDLGGSLFRLLGVGAYGVVASGLGYRRVLGGVCSLWGECSGCVVELLKYLFTSGRGYLGVECLEFLLDSGVGGDELSCLGGLLVDCLVSGGVDGYFVGRGVEVLAKISDVVGWGGRVMEFLGDYDGVQRVVARLIVEGGLWDYWDGMVSYLRCCGEVGRVGLVGLSYRCLSYLLGDWERLMVCLDNIELGLNDPSARVVEYTVNLLVEVYHDLYRGGVGDDVWWSRIEARLRGMGGLGFRVLWGVEDLRKRLEVNYE